jgi:CRISPR-associated protein Cas1
VNKARSAAHACLYGVVHSVIVALGCSPGLGFIHTGHERSFVYDVADLYKAEVTIPIAFRIAAVSPPDIGKATRHAVRDAMVDGKIMETSVRDIRWLLLGEDADGGAESDAPGQSGDSLMLWDEKHGFARNAVAYGRELDGADESEAPEEESSP